MIRTILTVLIHCLSTAFVVAYTEKIEELTKKLATATHTSKVDILNELSREYEFSDKAKSRNYANEAIKLGEKISYLPGIINGFLNLSFLLQIEGKTSEGIDLLDSAVILCIESNNKALLSIAYGRLGGMHIARGEINEAKRFAQLSLNIGNELDSLKLKLEGYHLLGIIHGTSGEYEKALEYFFKLLDYHTANQNEVNMASFLKSIGQTYRQIKKYDEAIDYLTRAYEIQHKLKNTQQVVWILTTIGSCYSNKGEDNKALGYYEKSLELARETDYLHMIINNLNQIGQYHVTQSSYEEAEKYLIEAYELNEKLGKNSHTIYLLGSLSDLYLELNRIPESIEFGKKQLEIAIEENVLIMIQGATENLAKAYSKKGDFEKAYFYQEELMALNDSIYNIEKSKQIEEIATRYETEKKEQEILTLAGEKQNVEFRRNLYGIIALLVFAIGVIVTNHQRLRSLKNKQLLEKEIELDRMKSRFFANISHEFRTPLTLILGPIDELISKIDQAEIKRQLRIMQRNADRLLELVNQLLELSKIESGNLKLSISTFDIISVIRGVTMSFHSLAEQKNITLKLHIPQERLEMNFDSAKFETILTNLLSNAFKFTPEQGRITVETQIVKKNEKYQHKEFLRIKVSDTGSGIPAEDLRLIFDRFYQSDNNQLNQQEGSGIGLALTKELVELHDGMIYAESKINEGTQIIIELPMDITPGKGQQLPGDEDKVRRVISDNEDLPVTVDGIDESAQGLPVVLVIEDHQDVRNYIQEILNKQFSVVTAIDGEEGIAKAMEMIPDLIISDVMMPKKNGYEVCGMLKYDEKTSHIPVILLTAKSDSDDRIAGLKTKADDYVTKPFVPRELLARIENLIESRNKLREKYKKEGVLRPKDVTVNSIDEQFLTKLIEMVEQHMSDERFGVEQLAEEIGMSRSNLHRKLTALIDQGPNEFIRSFRLQRAHDLISQNSASTSEIAYQVGFSSPSYFTKCFREQFGYVPTEIPR